MLSFEQPTKGEGLKVPKWISDPLTGKSINQLLFHIHFPCGAVAHAHDVHTLAEPVCTHTREVEDGRNGGFGVTCVGDAVLDIRILDGVEFAHQEQELLIATAISAIVLETDDVVAGLSHLEDELVGLGAGQVGGC